MIDGRNYRRGFMAWFLRVQVIRQCCPTADEFGHRTVATGIE